MHNFYKAADWALLARWLHQLLCLRQLICGGDCSAGQVPIDLTANQVVKQHRHGLQHFGRLRRVYEHTCCQVCPENRTQAVVAGNYRGYHPRRPADMLPAVPLDD